MASDKATAYHEAGHAIIAHMIGLGIRRGGMSIDKDADTDGRTHMQLPLGENPRNRTFRSWSAASGKVRYCQPGGHHCPEKIQPPQRAQIPRKH